MVALKCIWMFYLLFISLPSPTKPIHCDKLTNEDIRNVKMIVGHCGDSPTLERHPDASPKALDISSLTDTEFATLFSKKKTLKVSLKAWNSNIEKMIFGSLTSFQDEEFHETKSLIEVVNNRNLKYLGFPVFPKGKLYRLHNPKVKPILLVGNPLITGDNIRELRALGLSTMEWDTLPGVCRLTNIIKKLSDLNNCEIIGENLIIDEAVGETTAKIKFVNGNISITNSNISSISFLDPATWNPSSTQYRGLDVISSNPNLCLSEDQLTWLKRRGKMPRIIENNKNRLLCEEPNTTCVGGSLHDPAVRSQIEKTQCEVVIGDLKIDRLINIESDLTDSLRAGLSRIRKVLNGSIYITFNEGLKTLDFFQQLEVVQSKICQDPAIGIWSNYNLESINLSKSITLSHSRVWDVNCLKLSVEGNGPEGRGRVLTDSQLEHYRRRFGDEMSIWIHPRDESIIQYEKSQYDKLLWNIAIFVSVAIVSSGGIGFYAFKMRKRTNFKNTDSNGDEDNNESRKSEGNKEKKRNEGDAQIAMPPVPPVL